MHENEHQSHGRLPAAARHQISGAAFSALIAAAFLLFFGFINPFLRVEGDPLLDASIVLFNSTMRYGGILMLVSAMVCWLGMRYALLFDAIVSGLIALAMLGVGIVWIMKGSFQGYLLPIFALMFLHAARSNWVLHKAIIRGSAAGGDHVEVISSHSPVVDAEVKAEAREHVLDHLRQARAGASREIPGETAAAREFAPPETVQKPLLAAEPEPEPEKPGSGFLAELGRDEDKD